MLHRRLLLCFPLPKTVYTYLQSVETGQRITYISAWAEVKIVCLDGSSYTNFQTNFKTLLFIIQLYYIIAVNACREQGI